MRYGITCDGALVGMAHIAPLSGLAHAGFEPLPGYAAIQHHASDAGVLLRGTRHWPAADGDFAEDVARAWNGGRLALTDAEGIELAVASVVLLDHGHRAPVVVVDARPDMARVEAYLRTIGRGGDDTSQPAA